MIKKKGVLHGSIEASNKKYETQMNEKKKELEHLQYQKAKIVQEYNEKITQLRGKGSEIKELIEKAR